MNESRNGASAAEAVFGIFFIFTLLVVLLFKFGGNKDVVTNPETTKNNISLEENFPEPENMTIYDKYVKQIYDTQFATTSEKTSESIDSIISDYERELLAKTEIPVQEIVIKNVSDKFNPKYYAQNFELIFEDLRLRGGTSEGDILLAQIGENNSILELSEYDKEKISRIAQEYEIFADKISNLGTPSSVYNKALEIAVSAKKISFILKKMLEEKDERVYTLWISKYAENMSVIITDRYALQQL